MDMVSPILDVASRLWNCAAGHALYITGLEETLASLRTKIMELKAISKDLKLKVQLAEQQGMKRTEQVQLWMNLVETTENKVNEIFQKYEELTSNTSTCLNKCLCRSTYKIGKKAAKTLDIVTNLIKKKGEFQEVVHHLPFLAPAGRTVGLNMIPMENPEGIESTFQSVWEALGDDKIGKIGLYGMGGVGKTTLLKQINNELTKRGDYVFDVAIWLVASKHATEEAIQQVILQKLQIPSVNWRETIEENSALVYWRLKGRKYILMLDDVWERLDLVRMGIPLPDNEKSKIIFSTRSEDVCFRMKTDWTIKVRCLPQDKALSLFMENVGDAALTSHHEIPRLASLVAEECKGLPLALITIARAMASRKTLCEWLYALQQLKEYPSEFPDMGKHVLPVLKFSYDSLADSITQKCFLYCSLFPEDYEIASDKLVDLWIGEGYLKEHDVKEARNHGFSIIEDLKRACLLESGICIFYKSLIKMHDVIRDMALWIASDHSKHNKKFIILEEGELKRVQSNIRNWNGDVEKMSLWGNKTSANSYPSQNTVVEMFKNSITCICPRLSTLVVGSTQFGTSWESRFFKFVPCLRVLDLSGRAFLESSVALEVKGISELINLEHLNLSGLRIHRLPEECKHLSKLRYLIMDSMHLLKECPTEIIFCLRELLVFRMDSGPFYDEQFMRGLDNLEKLQETSINVKFIDSLEIFVKSEKLQNCARFMKLENMDANVLKLCPANMKNLETLRIIDSKFNTLECNPTLMVFNDLHRVVINHCEFLVDLDFLAYAPSLKYLHVTCCSSLQRILSVDDKYPEKYGGDVLVFPSLKHLVLHELPRLEIICNKLLTFPSLEFVKIRKCQMLQQNPFIDMMPANSKLLKIDVENEWWDSLKWREHERFQQDYFIEFINESR